MKEPRDNPCRRHGCSMCCVDTRMTLTEADVRRLEQSGFEAFYLPNADGDLVLRNSDGSCVLLEGGRCRAYPIRPEGCRLYPLVLDLGRDRVELDPFCPHRREFSLDDDNSRRLRRSVAVETAEAERRRRGVRG